MPSKKKRVNLTLDSRLYALTARTADLYDMPVSTFITHLLSSSANVFPQLIGLLENKKVLDEVTAIDALKLMPAFHLELGNQPQGRASQFPHTLESDGGSSDPCASNTGVVLVNRLKIVH